MIVTPAEEARRAREREARDTASLPERERVAPPAGDLEGETEAAMDPEPQALMCLPPHRPLFSFDTTWGFTMPHIGSRHFSANELLGGRPVPAGTVEAMARRAVAARGEPLYAVPDWWPRGQLNGYLNLTELSRMLEAIRASAGGHPIRIISGVRTPEENIRSGQARYSAHLLGMAADLQPVTGAISVSDIADAANAIRAYHIVYSDGQGRPSFVHVDTRHGYVA
jgi:hypothetical protein